jgi:hypothetical protein
MAGSFWNNWKGTAIPVQPSTVSTPNASGAYAGFKGTGTDTGGSVAADPYISDVLQMSDAQRLQLSQLLKNANYLNTVTSKYNKALGDAVTRAWTDLQIEAARSGRPSLSLRGFLEENASPTGGGVGGVASVPARSIYQYAPEQLGAKIQEIAVNLLGRDITEADKTAQWYKDLNKTLNKMVMQGTVSEPAKLVKNPKTGKMEKVSIQRPEVTTESISKTITTALEQADPISLERKKNLDFANWAFDKMGGRG